MFLAFDPRRQVSFKAVEMGNVERTRIHERIRGFDATNFSRCQTAKSSR